MDFQGFTRIKIEDLVSTTPVKVAAEKVEIEKKPNTKIRINKQEAPQTIAPMPNQYTKKVPVIPKEKVQFTKSEIKEKVQFVEPPKIEEPEPPVPEEKNESPPIIVPMRKYIDTSFEPYRNPYVKRIYTK